MITKIDVFYWAVVWDDQNNNINVDGIMTYSNINDWELATTELRIMLTKRFKVTLDNVSIRTFTPLPKI